MPLEVVVDSDIITKLCVYSLRIWEEGQMLAVGPVATLAASRYIIPKRLRHAKIAGKRQVVMDAFASFTRKASFIEPNQEELALAATLELSAQRRGVAFDTGESQLLAILVRRDARILLTGDKRAVAALAILAAEHAEAAAAAGRVACLEQLFIKLLNLIGGATLRNIVCAEPAADTALSICFCCASGAAHDEVYLEGLTSYLNDLRHSSGEVLCADAALPSAPEKDGVGRG